MDFLASVHGAIILLIATIVSILLCVLFAGLAATHEPYDKIDRSVWVIMAFLSQILTGVGSLGVTISIVLNIIRYAKHV